MCHCVEVTNVPFDDRKEYPCGDRPARKDVIDSLHLQALLSFTELHNALLLFHALHCSPFFIKKLISRKTPESQIDIA
jgi:hypothetical protein